MIYLIMCISFLGGIIAYLGHFLAQRKKILILNSEISMLKYHLRNKDAMLQKMMQQVVDLNKKKEENKNEKQRKKTVSL